MHSKSNVLLSISINKSFIFCFVAHSGATVNQLLRRAAAAAALRRERNNSSQSEELSLKRQRSDNGLSGNNNSPDVINHMPQVTAADFSTIKHNNNNTPPMKDAERAEDYSTDSKSQYSMEFFLFSF